MINSIIKFLANPRIVFYTLIWLMILLIIGTVAQKYIGLENAQRLFFSSYIVWFSWMPLPGGLVTLGFLTLSMMVKLFFASNWSAKNSGIIVTHVGALLLLLGGLVTYLYSQEGNMVLYEGESANFFSDYYEKETLKDGTLRFKQTLLPFEIELIDFEKRMYPDTSTPQSYKSEVILRENGAEWRSIIQMNEPLRYRGYTFYQSSFIIEDEREATVLAVVKNAGRMFPYISSIVMCIGLLIHVFIRLPKLIRKSVAAIIFMGAILSPMQASAQIGDFTEFARIPILDEGRVKPLDSFARTQLEIIYGRDKLPDMSAIEWLAEVIFNPDTAYERKIFNIADPRIADALGLKRRKGHRFSYRELTIAFYSNTNTWKSLISMPAEEMSLPQRQLLEVFIKTQIFGELSRSLSLLFPDFKIFNAEMAEVFGAEEGAFISFREISKQKSFINKMAVELQEGVSSQESMAMAGMAKHMRALSGDKSSDILKIIPPQWEKVTGDSDLRMWFSPWGIGEAGQGSPDSVKFLDMWSDIIKAYRAGDALEWAALNANIYEFSLEMVGSDTLDSVLSLEVSFNNFKPFFVSFTFYMAAFFAILLSFMMFSEGFRRLAFWLVVAGFSFHFAGIGVRMFIMGRPPVTNLYESVIFVSLIASMFGIFMEWRLRNTIGIIIAVSLGVVLHFIGMKFDAEGDTMGMLAAVLDTNFWLATHVITITIGYGACFVAGVLGHIYLIMRLATPHKTAQLSELYRNMRGIVFVALLFSVIGTILGGIWADQSWGRFWGWDPKENGALLIVLWLTFVIHGRLSGDIGELGFAVSMVITNIVVAMAWFGVNLLGVGLHSYGFTEGATIGFVMFCSFELLFAAVFYAVIRLRKIERGAGL